VKIKKNVVCIKKLALLLVLLYVFDLLFAKFMVGAIFYGINKKKYQNGNVVITLPRGWYNGRFSYKQPYVFMTYDQKSIVDFEYYDTKASDGDKYESIITKQVNTATLCYIANINNNVAYLFEKQLENTFAILAYIPSARLEVFYESEDKKTANGQETNHDKRIKRILSNIEIDKKDNKMYYDIDESLKNMIYSKCEDI
jgi:glutathione peroxidase-family protein